MVIDVTTKYANADYSPGYTEYKPRMAYMYYQEDGTLTSPQPCLNHLTWTSSFNTVTTDNAELFAHGDHNHNVAGQEVILRSIFKVRSPNGAIRQGGSYPSRIYIKPYDQGSGRDNLISMSCVIHVNNTHGGY